MKYINFEHIGIVIFGNHIQHSDMKQLIGKEVISAGSFCASNAKCYGESISLMVRSQPEDTQWVKNFVDDN